MLGDKKKKEKENMTELQTRQAEVGRSTEYDNENKKQKKDANIGIIKSQLKTIISSTSKTIGGKTRFKLENNQLWESQSVLSSIKLNNFRAKNNVVLEEANMGGFWMINASSNVKIKVKRIS